MSSIELSSVWKSIKSWWLLKSCSCSFVNLSSNTKSGIVFSINLKGVLSSKRLLELINSILDISKLESNKEVLNNEDYNLDTLFIYIHEFGHVVDLQSIEGDIYQSVNDWKTKKKIKLIYFCLFFKNNLKNNRGK